MGCESWGRRSPLEPCANCKRREGSYMSSEFYRIPAGWLVCGRSCGQRLNARIKSGMVPDPTEAEVSPLRIRIKQLSAQLRQRRHAHA